MHTFARLDAVALGAACGIVGGFGVFVATVILLIRDGPEMGSHVNVVSQNLIGYSATWQGSIVGALYGAITGFIAGWTLAAVRNLTIAVYFHAIRLWSQLSTEHFLDRFDS
jgi:hypothetical protein